MADLANLDENMIQLMISSKKSVTSPSVISLSDLEVATVDCDELKLLDQYHEEVLEMPEKLNSCENKSSRNASIEQEVSRRRTRDIMAIPEDGENNPDYTRNHDRIIKHSSMDSRCDILEHLLFDILLWLPVTILLRFKSVCKSWYALIGSSNFIAQHFDHSCGKDNLLGLYSPHDEDGSYDGFKCCFLTGDKYEVYNNLDCGQCWQFVEETDMAFSSHGIICLVHFNNEVRDVALFNPAMKQLRRLPKSSVPQDYAYFFFGFGFNVKSSDHNFVRTAFCKENMHDNLVQVYSSRADSWRTIHVAFPFRSYRCVENHVAMNGTCYWIAYVYRHSSFLDESHNTQDDVLLSFDLHDETYETMSLPVGKVCRSAALEIFGDKLAYIDGVGDCEYLNGSQYYEIWVLHEYGVKESWTKVWNVGPTIFRWTDDVRFPAMFSKDGKYLLLSSFENMFGKVGSFYLYNLGTEENEYLELQQPNISFWWLVRYTESLVSLKRVNDAHIDKAF